MEIHGNPFCLPAGHAKNSLSWLNVLNLVIDCLLDVNECRQHTIFHNMIFTCRRRKFNVYLLDPFVGIPTCLFPAISHFSCLERCFAHMISNKSSVRIPLGWERVGHSPFSYTSDHFPSTCWSVGVCFFPGICVYHCQINWPHCSRTIAP